MKKLLILGFVITSVIITCIASVNAGTANGDKSERPPVHEGIRKDGTVWEEYPGRSGNFKKVEWSHEHINKNTGDDSMTVSLSRTKSSSITGGAKYEAEVAWFAVKGKFEVSLSGTMSHSETETWSHTFTFPAKTLSRASAGSKYTKLEGRVATYEDGRIAKSTDIHIQYTTGKFTENNAVKKLK